MILLRLVPLYIDYTSAQAPLVAPKDHPASMARRRLGIDTSFLMASMEAGFPVFFPDVQ
jgi:hypothetical protein